MANNDFQATGTVTRVIYADPARELLVRQACGTGVPIEIDGYSKRGYVVAVHEHLIDGERYLDVEMREVK